MSDEFENETENFSSFYPLLILIIGLLLWLGYQDFEANSVRARYNEQFQAAIPTIKAAQGISTRYVALMKDLAETSAKDPAAAQIVKDAIKAGLIRVNQSAGTNTASTNAAPTNDAPDSSSSTSSTPEK